MVIKLSIIKGMRAINSLIKQGSPDLAYQVALDLSTEIDCQDDKELVDALFKNLGDVRCTY